MTAEDGSERCCWICLGDQSCGELAHTCNCPPDRVVHRKCLARWQLQSAGKTEETRCRFCNAVYPSWKESLTPKNLKPAIPVVSVHYNGVTYRLKVRPGPEGLASFQKQLQCITGLSELECMQITFQCRAPETSEELNFKGISAFDAAIHCAAISASEREREQAAAAAAAAATAAAASAAASSSAAPCVRDEGDQRWATPSSTRSRAGSDAASSSSSRRRLSVPDEIVAAPLGRDSSASDGGYNRQQSALHAEGVAPAPHQPQLSRYARASQTSAVPAVSISPAATAAHAATDVASGPARSFARSSEAHLNVDRAAAPTAACPSAPHQPQHPTGRLRRVQEMLRTLFM